MLLIFLYKYRTTFVHFIYKILQTILQHSILYVLLRSSLFSAFNIQAFKTFQESIVFVSRKRRQNFHSIFILSQDKSKIDQRRSNIGEYLCDTKVEESIGCTYYLYSYIEHQKFYKYNYLILIFYVYML